MFTGLIETLGTVRSVTRGDRSALIGLTADASGFAVASGDSVAIDGVCLTLEKLENERLVFRAVEETLSRTTLGELAPGGRVNLERALRPADRLGGHFVLGHVDCVGRIAEDRRQGDSLVRAFDVERDLGRFMAAKGSVAIDGISLTIVSAANGRIAVSFIPYSLGHTTMARKKPGDAVNIEVDVLARYTARLLEGDRADGSRAPVPEKDSPSLYEKMERLGF